MEESVFPGDADRQQIWQMLMTRDFEAFAACDFSIVEDDFIADIFFGVSGNLDTNIRNWKPTYYDLASYRESWLREAKQAAKTADLPNLVSDLLSACSLEQIDINGNMAVAHKLFDGDYRLADGGRSPRMLWQTLYYCRKTPAGWKICGFLGYLPLPLTQQ